jgi:hypothetical protein
MTVQIAMEAKPIYYPFPIRIYRWINMPYDITKPYRGERSYPEVIYPPYNSLDQ